MFLCYNCQDSISTIQILDFSFLDINSNLCQLCDECVKTINSKLLIQIDFSKLKLLKHKIRCKQTKLKDF